MNYDSDDLNVLKQKVGFRLNNGQYLIKPGILMDFDSFLQSLRMTNVNLPKATPIDCNNDNLTIAQDFLVKYPIIMSLIQYYSTEQLNPDDTDEEEKRIKEGEFRFDIVGRHLSLSKTNIAFCSEDCTAIVPKVTYDVNSNSFVGFSLPLVEGRPITNHYRTECLAQLESWFSSTDKSTLLNIHMIQPITSTEKASNPIILSAYGTNSKYTSLDIIRRWIWIFHECIEKNIRIIGFSTDGDPKYLKAMRLVLAEMIIGNQRISLDILSEMIANKNKLKHGLVKSDIYPSDKQNLASCEKISSNSVISTLEEISSSLATSLYLKLIRSVIIAYIDRGTSINDRVYHAWFTVFLCRIWWAWLLTKAEYDFDEMLSWSSEDNSSQSIGKLIRRFFITNTSFQSIEINAHQLTYLILLVIEGSLPIESLQIFLFSSQTCENTLHSARATSVFTSCSKTTILNRIKSENEINISTIKTPPLRFPKQHKQMSKAIASSTSSITSSLTKVEIERIVASVFDEAFKLLGKIDVHNSLKKKKIHTFRNLNNFVLNKMSTKSKTVDWSSLTEVSSDSESESESESVGKLTSDNSMDIKHVGKDSDDESDVYSVNDRVSGAYTALLVTSYSQSSTFTIEASADCLPKSSTNNGIYDQCDISANINVPFPDEYSIPSLPDGVIKDIEAGSLHTFGPHYTNRQILIDAISYDLIEKYKLFYPSSQQFDKIGNAIVKFLKLPLTKENITIWKDALQTKLKRKRAENLDSIIVQDYRLKYSRAGSGRPVKRRLDETAQRDRYKSMIIIPYNDDISNDIETKVNRLRDLSQIDVDTQLKLWKETLHCRRQSIRNRSTADILKDFPGYSNSLLVLEEVKMLMKIDLAAAARRQIPELLNKVLSAPIFITDSPSIRLMKILCKEFDEPIQHIFCNNEPSTPYPTLVCIDDVIYIYVDFVSMLSTNSPDDALALLIAMYTIFELTFHKKSRTIRLLYSILHAETRYLTNSVRILIKEKNIDIYAEQQHQQQKHQVILNVSPNASPTFTAEVNSLTTSQTKTTTSLNDNLDSNSNTSLDTNDNNNMKKPSSMNFNSQRHTKQRKKQKTISSLDDQNSTYLTANETNEHELRPTNSIPLNDLTNANFNSRPKRKRRL
ncbi:unnamed protein product [Rotaria magnacalcarata]